MTKLEETTVSNGANNLRNDIPKKKEVKADWKAVTIGGLTGIFFGVASSVGTNIYAATKRGEEKAAENIDPKNDEIQQEVVAKSAPKAKPVEKTTPEKDEEPVDDVTVEEDVQVEVSFEDAFNQAREVQGPGGLFVWDGKVCTTYTEEEWNSLTETQREEFAMNAKNFTEDGKEAVDVQTVDDPIDYNTVIAETEPDNTNNQTASEDVDVQIIGSKTVTLPNGQVVDMTHARIKDEDVAIIDVDQDGIGDIAMADLNHNGIPDEGEIIDLNTKQVISAGKSYEQAEDIHPETDPSVNIETEFDTTTDDSFITDDSGLNDTVLI